MQTMRKMDDLQFVNFVELQLDSKDLDDFNTAYDIALSAGLVDYAKKFIIFQPGDWPCQFFCSQIIYQCVKKLISYQQPHQVNRAITCRILTSLIIYRSRTKYVRCMGM